MMFKGNKGIIMTSGFKVEEPYLLSGDIKATEEVSAAAGAVKMPGAQRFIEGVRNKKQIAVSFRHSWPITEAVNLYAVALRANNTLYYDAERMKVAEAENK
jgi:hypothetical protein